MTSTELTLVGANVGVPAELAPVGRFIDQIRPEWRGKRLIQRVMALLPVDPSSACQRLLNAAIQDLRSKIVIAGLDLATEAAKLHKLPPVAESGLSVPKRPREALRERPPNYDIDRIAATYAALEAEAFAWLTYLRRFGHFWEPKYLSLLESTPEGRHYSGVGGADVVVILGDGWAGSSSFSFFSNKLSSGSGSV